MALVIAVAKRCDGCIAYHAKAAALRGATHEELAEALSVALLMDGDGNGLWPEGLGSLRRVRHDRSDADPLKSFNRSAPS